MASKKVKEIELAAEYINPDELIPWPNNPRKNEGAIDSVAESIKEFGFATPIVARRENKMICAGHTRWEAAKKLGLDKVPVRFMDLTEEQFTRLALADNRLGELAAWDDAKLYELLSQEDDQTRYLLGWANYEFENLEKMFNDESEDDEGKDGGKKSGKGSESKSGEVDEEGLAKSLKHSCPKCGFKW